MSIATRIQSIETHLTDDYKSLNRLGLYNNENKNIENISPILEGFYDKVSQKTDIDTNGVVGDTSQDSTTGKNLLVNTATTDTINGVTFTVNSDHSITIKGTASGDAYFYLTYINGSVSTFTLPAGTYTRYASTSGNDITGITLQLRKGSVAGLDIFNSAGVGLKTVTLSEDTVVACRLRILNGTAISTPVTIYPMIVSGSYTISTIPPYEPYTGGIPAPNPSYPQPITNRTGTLSYKVSGKNKEDFSTVTYTQYSSTVTREGSEIKVVGGSASYASCQFSQTQLQLRPNTTYTFSAKIKSTTNTNGSLVYASADIIDTATQKWGTQVSAGNISSVTFTTPSTFGANAFIGIYTGGTNNTAVFTDLMLNEGSTALPYEPYITPQTFPLTLGDTELCKIGTYQDFIKKSTGKNLANITITGKVPSLSNGQLTNLSGSACTDYIAIDNTKEYVFSYTANNTVIPYLCFYGENNSYLGYAQVNSSGYTLSSYSNYSSAKSVIIRLDQYSRIETTMLNEGSTALPYEPYGEVFYLKKEIGKKILIGSSGEGWTLETNGNFGTRNLYFGDRKIFTTSYEGLLSNYYTVAGSGDYYIRWRGTNEYNVAIHNKDISTVEDFKTWLSTHNTTVYYVLSTPTYTTITSGTLYDNLVAIENYLVSYKINKEFILGYDSPEIEVS